MTPIAQSDDVRANEKSYDLRAPVECTIGVAFLRGEMLLFKNRDLDDDTIARGLFKLASRRNTRVLHGVDLGAVALSGVSIGVNRCGICVANTHVATTSDVACDVLCGDILAQARSRRDVPRIAKAFVKDHGAAQGGRLLVCADHKTFRWRTHRRVAAARWVLLIEVYRGVLRIEPVEESRAFTNHFSLISARRVGLDMATEASRAREATANRLLAKVTSVGELKSLLRSHVPEKSACSICRHGERSNTESSHIIRVRGRRVA